MDETELQAEQEKQRVDILKNRLASYKRACEAKAEEIEAGLLGLGSKLDEISAALAKRQEAE